VAQDRLVTGSEPQLRRQRPNRLGNNFGSTKENTDTEAISHKDVASTDGQQAPRHEEKTGKRVGRPVKQEVVVAAIVILPQGTMDIGKRIKKPGYDDISTLVNQGLAICLSVPGALVFNRTWSSDEGLAWITSLFPSLTSVLYCKHPNESNYGLLPLAPQGQSLKIVSGFEGAAFVGRIVNAKSSWEKRVLYFITKFKLQTIEIATLDPPALLESFGAINADKPVAGPSGSGPSPSASAEAEPNSLCRSSRLMGTHGSPSPPANAITVHGSDSDEPLSPKEEFSLPPQGSSFVFTDPLAEFL
ncbi:hypothetical protein FRB90_011822, partial [Tulasnella sp. 427]